MSQAMIRALLAAEDTRSVRVGQMLHAGLAQNVTALLLGLKTLELRLATDPASVARIKALASIVTTMGTEVSEVAHELRPVSLDALGLERVLSAYLLNWSALTGIVADFDEKNCAAFHLSLPIEVTLFRVISEALSNVVKHAKAHHVSVVLQCTGNSAVAVVSDDGVGFDLAALRASRPSRSHGIGVSRHWVALVHGKMTIESHLGRGTTVSVTIPLTSPGARGVATQKLTMRAPPAEPAKENAKNSNEAPGSS